jgi:hypothetical protein
MLINSTRPFFTKQGFLIFFTSDQPTTINRQPTTNNQQPTIFPQKTYLYTRNEKKSKIRRRRFYLHHFTHRYYVMVNCDTRSSEIDPGIDS